MRRKDKISVKKMDMNTIAYLKSINDFSIKHTDAKEVFNLSSNRVYQLEKQGFIEKYSQKGNIRYRLGVKGNGALKYHNIFYKYKTAGYRHDKKLCEIVFENFLKESENAAETMLRYVNETTLRQLFSHEIKDFVKSYGKDSISVVDGAIYNPAEDTFQMIEVVGRSYSDYDIQKKLNYANLISEKSLMLFKAQEGRNEMNWEKMIEECPIRLYKTDFENGISDVEFLLLNSKYRNLLMAIYLIGMGYAHVDDLHNYFRNNNDNVDQFLKEAHDLKLLRVDRKHIFLKARAVRYVLNALKRMKLGQVCNLSVVIKDFRLRHNLAQIRRSRAFFALAIKNKSIKAFVPIETLQVDEKKGYIQQNFYIQVSRLKGEQKEFEKSLINITDGIITDSQAKKLVEKSSRIRDEIRGINNLSDTIILINLIDYMSHIPSYTFNKLISTYAEGQFYDIIPKNVKLKKGQKNEK